MSKKHSFENFSKYYSRVIGFFGLAMIAILMTLYTRKMYNYDPWFMNDSKEINACIIDKKITPRFKSVVNELVYKYQIGNEVFEDSYFSNELISNLSIGDSVKLEVSSKWPSRNKLKGIQKRKID